MTGRAMGTFAEDAAREYQFTREQMDEYAIESLRRANEAIHPRQVREGNHRRSRSSPARARSRSTSTSSPARAIPRRSRSCSAAFAKDGTITAATSSSISDGAAALVLTRESVARQARQDADRARSSPSRARAGAPKFTVRPGRPRSRRCSTRPAGSVGDVDLFEVNEAFACVAMIAMRDIGIPRDKINVNGGATALGHPIGASGARITTTLIDALAGPRPQARRREPVHRRRRGDRGGGGAGLSEDLQAKRTAGKAHSSNRGEEPMRLTICFAATLVLCACSKQAEAPPAADNMAEVTTPLRPRLRPLSRSMKPVGTYTDPKTKQGRPGINRRQRQLRDLGGRRTHRPWHRRHEGRQGLLHECDEQGGRGMLVRSQA